MGGERVRERDLLTQFEMKESGSLDFKALRKDKVLPMKGQPMSPGGRVFFFSPNLLTKYHSFALFRIRSIAPNPPIEAVKTKLQKPNSIFQFPWIYRLLDNKWLMFGVLLAYVVPVLMNILVTCHRKKIFNSHKNIKCDEWT